MASASEAGSIAGPNFTAALRQALLASCSKVQTDTQVCEMSNIVIENCPGARLICENTGETYDLQCSPQQRLAALEKALSGSSSTNPFASSAAAEEVVRRIAQRLAQGGYSDSQGNPITLPPGATISDALQTWISTVCSENIVATQIVDFPSVRLQDCSDTTITGFNRLHASEQCLLGAVSTIQFPPFPPVPGTSAASKLGRTNIIVLIVVAAVVLLLIFIGLGFVLRRYALGKGADAPVVAKPTSPAVPKPTVPSK